MIFIELDSKVDLDIKTYINDILAYEEYRLNYLGFKTKIYTCSSIIIKNEDIKIRNSLNSITIYIPSSHIDSIYNYLKGHSIELPIIINCNLKKLDHSILLDYDIKGDLSETKYLTDLLIELICNSLAYEYKGTSNDLALHRIFIDFNKLDIKYLYLLNLEIKDYIAFKRKKEKYFITNKEIKWIVVKKSDSIFKLAKLNKLSFKELSILNNVNNQNINSKKILFYLKQT